MDNDNDTDTNAVNDGYERKYDLTSAEAAFGGAFRATPMWGMIAPAFKANLDEYFSSEPYARWIDGLDDTGLFRVVTVGPAAVGLLSEAEQVRLGFKSPGGRKDTPWHSVMLEALAPVGYRAMADAYPALRSGGSIPELRQLPTLLDALVACGASSAGAPSGEKYVIRGRKVYGRSTKGEVTVKIFPEEGGKDEKEFGLFLGFRMDHVRPTKAGKEEAAAAVKAGAVKAG